MRDPPPEWVQRCTRGGAYGERAGALGSARNKPRPADARRNDVGARPLRPVYPAPSDAR